ncbi:hypothetical protein SAMN04487906_1544 [Zhouia amylolytica]|uniref:IPExxxVDY family protein n=2 Tax=Zhouia amylolytica TaxID=376730 RepID=W2UMM4_9FLAO|nr:IPExxxVDY family protein [Zhouia amylolytica]ETN94716.1 hypothetical protein P278_26590 [Zhouia amylolytica AD3]MCQ0110898.1 IPExxxVDY family protein [Zhouia amylolytica]SFS74973.1 hypothetical protein SAMN04487906_1544 [Zhouia amylolytica]
MAVHKLLDDLYEHSYSLIAIHSPLKDYRLAYFINHQLSLRLKRTKEDFSYIEDASFSTFHHNDETTDTTWHLITNVSKIVANETRDADLFGVKSTTVVKYLIPEYKKVDYFLKIDNGDFFYQLKAAIKAINDLTHVVTAYAIDPNQLKSKNNLIFLSNA